MVSVAYGQGKDNDVVITLERTTCYGTCPAYKLTIRGDGSVLYEGHKFVRVTGPRQSKIDAVAVAKLVQAFIDADYFGLKDRYRTIQNPDGTESMVTDLLTTYTAFTLNKRHKDVEDYVGGPKRLEELEEQIDKAAGSKRWIAIDAASVHEEALHGWDIRSAEARKLLQEAAEAGDIDVVQAFISEGADVNSRAGTVTPLQRARGVEVVRALIAAGADVDVSSKEHFGPPLIFAAERGDAESIRALLDGGAKVDGRSPDGETPLIEAAKSGNPTAVKVLLQAGANANARDNYGECALSYASHGLAHQEELAKHPDPFGDPLPDYAERYKEIREMLLTAGAREENPSTK